MWEEGGAAMAVAGAVPLNCWLRVASQAGQVLLHGRVDASATVAFVKSEIGKSEGIPEGEQLLSIGGAPLSDVEVIRKYMTASGEGEAGDVEVVDMLLRRVSPDWALLLEDLSQGHAGFEHVRMRLREESHTAQQLARERGGHLAALMRDMNTAFQEALKRVNESGSALLAAAGDLQRNRDTVFEVVPRSSKGCRQAAEELMLCRNAVLAAVQSNGKVLVGMQAQLEPVHKAVAKALRESGAALQQAKEAWRREGELLHFAQARGWLFANTAEDLGRSYTASLRGITRDGKSLEAVADAIAACRQAFRRAVVVNRNAIRQAEASLQRDQEVIFGWAMDHVSEIRKCDRNFIMTVIEANGEALERAPEEFRHDRELVLAAVRQSDGWALEFAAEELKHDREVVMAAVRRNGWALQHAGESLRNDRELVLAAVQANGLALEHASAELREDPVIVEAAVRSSPAALRFAAPALLNDRRVVIAAVRQNGWALEHAGESLRDDKELVLAAVQANGLVLEHASPKLREDRCIVEAALRSSPAALRFAGAPLLANREVVRIAVQKDGFVLQYAAPELRGDRELLLQAIAEAGPGALEFASADLRGDPDVLAAAVLSGRRKRQQENSLGTSEEVVATWNESRESRVERTDGSARGPDCVQL